MDSHPLYSEAKKNKKMVMKLRKLREFCHNVSSYVETMAFKLRVEASSGQDSEIEEII